METRTVVLSLGGSLIVPDELDTVFLIEFKELILRMKDRRFFIICGGGRLARKYQDAAKRVAAIAKDDLDWIGIRATRLNAEVVRAGFGTHAYEKVVHDPDEEISTQRRVIVGAGFRPGGSTDLRAVQLAKRFGAVEVINMSDIDYVYSADPSENPDARALTSISWSEFREMVGDRWEPGLNVPFDPVASKEAHLSGIRAFFIGRDIDNLGKVLRGEDFRGTVIS